MPYPIPPAADHAQIQRLLNDPGRLDDIEVCGLLADDRPVFDHLVETARALSGSPVSFFSVPMPDRDVYIGHAGFPAEIADQGCLYGETFCHHAIRSAEPLVLDDTLAHDGYRDVPTVASLGIRAYLGVPVVLDGRSPVGSLCVVDFVPRQWSDDEVTALRELAASAARELALRATMRRLQEEREHAWDIVVHYEKTLAGVAHDLRAMLANIDLSAQMLMRSTDPERSRELAVQVLESTAHMSAVTGDLLRHRKPLPPDAATAMSTPVARALAAARSLLQQQADACGIRIECADVAPSLLIAAPRADVLRVLGNLIGNAIGVMPRGGCVRISAAARGDDQCVLTVCDDGPGFPEGMDDRVFEPGFQVEGQASGGHGLGLSIVRDIVQRYGGRLKVGNMPTGGAVVEVVLPRVVR